MGDAYKGNADGTSLTSAYGLWWSYPSAGGPAGNLTSHGLMCIVNGAFYASLDASMRAITDMRAPIFYDYNDTAYYCNPNSVSRVNEVQSDRTYGFTDIRAPIYYDYNNTGYYTDQASTSNYNVLAVQRAYAGYDAGVTNSFSCSDWFRSSGTSGWYNATYAGGIYMVDSTYVRVYNSKALYVDNTILATNNITAYYSDERLKTNLGAIDNALDKVLSLEGFRYVENDLARSLGYTNEEEQVGLSAQRVQAILPQAVSLAPFDMQTGEFDGVVTSKSGENYLTVDYSRLVPLLVEAIKELKSELDAVKSRIH